MSIELSRGEQAMLEHAREEAAGVAELLKAPVDLDQLRTARRALDHAKSSVDFLITQNAPGGAATIRAGGADPKRELLRNTKH